MADRPACPLPVPLSRSQDFTGRIPYARVAKVENQPLKPNAPFGQITDRVGVQALEHFDWQFSERLPKV